MRILLHCHLAEKALWQIAKSPPNGNLRNQPSLLYQYIKVWLILLRDTYIFCVPFLNQIDIICSGIAGFLAPKNPPRIWSRLMIGAGILPKHKRAKQSHRCDIETSPTQSRTELAVQVLLIESVICRSSVRTAHILSCPWSEGKLTSHNKVQKTAGRLILKWRGRGGIIAHVPVRRQDDCQALHKS